MANEIADTKSLTITKGTIADTLSVAGTMTLTGTNFIKATQGITTAANVAINLGALSTIGAFMIKNADNTNFVDVLSSTTGTTFLHILPGQSAGGYFHSTVTAPAAKASTAIVQIEYIIAEI